jgi:hypothetical protein
MHDHVISALERLYARHSGALRKAEDDAQSLRAGMVHIEAVLRIYRAEWNAESVKPIRSRKASRWMNRGEGLRTALDVLREASEPLTTHEIVRLMFQRRELPEPDAVTLRAAAGPVHKALRDREGIVAFDGKPKRWALVR